MINFINKGGSLMWILLLVSAVIAILIIRQIIFLFFKKDSTTIPDEKGLNAILFWGGFSLVFGFLAHYIGLYNAMNAISESPEISPDVVSRGYQESLTTVIFGMVVFLAAFVSWFFLKTRVNKPVKDST